MEQCWLLIISILVWVSTSINGDTDPSDAAALNAMYSSLNSPGQLTGWSTAGNDPCGQNWKGVTCSGSRVTKIEVSNLGLSGSLGYQLTSLSSVTDFDVSHNNLVGNIPYQLPQRVQRLNLAFNNFNGPVPYIISNMTSLQNLNLAHNQLNQQLSDMFQALSQLSVLDLSFNQISGPLPSTFSSLSNIDSMHLENNQFTGTIDVLANLPLSTLDIEDNHFTGWIPDQLKSINLQTSGNSFSSGPAPPPPPGTPPAKTNHHRSGSKNGDKSGGKGSGIGGGAIAGIVIALLFVGAVVIFFLVKKRSKRSARDLEKSDNQTLTPLASADVQVHEAKSVQNLPSIDTVAYVTAAPISLKPPPFDHKSFDEDDMSNKFVSVPVPDPVIAKKATTVPPNVKLYSIADLQIATGSFSIDNLLGEGSIGRVYRAEFDDGKVLAVKKIDSTIISSYPEDFTVIVASISQFNHPNITNLVGYCSEHGQHLLVYEFHENGSLHDFLHLPDEFTKPLSWNSRVKVALGSARALEYLHEACSPSVVHNNFKSENILLDGEMNPHVSDCGLSSLVPDADQAINHNACAPEVADSGQYSLKSDVYSFGVVMLELLTGRKPFDSSKPRSEQSLVRWATPQLHDIDALTKMVDPDLEGLYPVKSLSRFADVIALCIQPEPEFRPPMSEVVQALVRLVQRANMSKRTVGARQTENSEDDSVN